MQSSKQGDYIYGNSEWFIAKITAVCPPDPELGVCGNYTCSWEQYTYCPNMQKFTNNLLELQNGNCTDKYNVAVPISEQDPTSLIGSFVLMRQRGATDSVYNIFEFVTMGAGAGPISTLCFGVTSVQCSNNILQVVSTNAGGCVSCTGGLAYYTYGEEFELPTNVNTGLPNRWTLQKGDLADCGLEIDGNTFVNNANQTINLKVTFQAYFTPQGLGPTQSRWANIVKNGDQNNIPIASFSTSNQTFTALECSNFITLADGEFFQPYCFQDGGAGIFVGGPEKVPTTLLIEKLCL
jgi:hypothetical protein